MPHPKPCSTCENRGWILAPLTECERARRSARLQHLLGIDIVSTGLIGRIIECPAICDAAIGVARHLYRRPVAA